jgi:hypothetical protein
MKDERTLVYPANPEGVCTRYNEALVFGVPVLWLYFVHQWIQSFVGADKAKKRR